MYRHFQVVGVVDQSWYIVGVGLDSIWTWGGRIAGSCPVCWLSWHRLVHRDPFLHNLEEILAIPVYQKNSAKLSGNNYHKIFTPMRCVSYGKYFLVFFPVIILSTWILYARTSLKQREILWKLVFFINVCVYWLKQEIMVPSHGSLPGQLKNFPLRIHSFHFAENVPALLPVFLVLASYISPSWVLKESPQHSVGGSPLYTASFPQAWKSSW